MTGPFVTAHPAKFSDALIPVFQEIIDEWRGTSKLPPMVLDPFAGTGRIHELENCRTVGIELEPEWAVAHPHTFLGDATKLPVHWTSFFDFVITSPCVTPDMRILTADLRWVPAGDIKVGDRLLAFDEFSKAKKSNGYAHRRHYDWAEVTHAAPGRKECARVTLSNGDVVTTTTDHPWLTIRSAGHCAQLWTKTSDLRPGVTQVLQQVRPWSEVPSSWEAGWLAGMFDGEGSMYFGSHGSPKMHLCQVEGRVNDAVGERLTNLGYSFNQIPRRPVEGRQQVINTYINGGWPGLIAALGQLRPERLLRYFQAGDISAMCIQPERVTVESVEPIGEQDIAGIETSTGTFICEGYLHHNTYGNRMADHHEARDSSTRITYRHKLGRPLSPNNSGAMQWGAPYRELHFKAWIEVQRVLKPGGIFVCNVRNHFRRGREVLVSEWHLLAIKRLGFTLLYDIWVPTPGMRFGANSALRVGGEHVYVFHLPNPKEDS